MTTGKQIRENFNKNVYADIDLITYKGIVQYYLPIYSYSDFIHTKNWAIKGCGFLWRSGLRELFGNVLQHI